MAQQWAEDDGDLPFGVLRLGQSEPVNGRKYVMYHGTTREAAQAIRNSGFRQSTGGMLGRGVYLSRDLEKAKRYPIDHPEKDKVVIKVMVNVGKVIAINYQGHPRQKTWHDHGYDTAWVPPNCGMVPSGLEEDCVWDPKRIQILSTIQPEAAPGQVQHSAQWDARDFMHNFPYMPFQRAGFGYVVRHGECPQCCFQRRTGHMYPTSINQSWKVAHALRVSQFGLRTGGVAIALTSIVQSHNSF